MPTGPLPQVIICCCGCLIRSDDFNRADANPPSGDWNVVGGEWRIFSNQLSHVIEGVLLTTARQAAPTRAGAKYAISFSVDLIEAAGDWKVICGYTSTGNFDWVHFAINAGGFVTPKFYRRSGGADTLLMDITTHPMGPEWSFTAGVLRVTICWAETGWSVAGPGSSSWVYCQGGAVALPAAPLGLVGFLKGTLDNWTYYQHWESKPDCNPCPCACWDGVDYQCIPETLYLTLTPTVNHLACTSTPATLTFALRQSTPTEPLTPPPVYRKNPDKYRWYSDVIHLAELNRDMWFRLTCNGLGSFTLTILDYPSGSISADSYPVDGILFKDGFTHTKLSTATLCNPINVTFPDLLKSPLDIGSGGPATCTPFTASEYSVAVTQ